MLFDILSGLKRNTFRDKQPGQPLEDTVVAKSLLLIHLKMPWCPIDRKPILAKGSKLCVTGKIICRGESISYQFNMKTTTENRQFLNWVGTVIYSCLISATTELRCPLQLLCWVVPYPCLKRPSDHWPSHAWQRTSIAWQPYQMRRSRKTIRA